MDSKFIKGYEGRYSIYEDGRVFSHIVGRFIKPSTSMKGYKVVSLHRGKGVKSQFKIHRLIMIHFKPVKDMDNLVVNHLNGVKTDNRISNLEWCSTLENNKHALDTGLNRGKNKLTDSQVLEIKDKIDKLKPNTIAFISKTIAEYYGVSWRTIESIVVGSRWSHLNKATYGV